MAEPTLTGTLVSGLNLRKGRAIDDDNWAPYVVVALLERNDYDTLLAKQQLDPHSFLYNYQRVYPQRRNTYRTDPPKEQSETEIKWTDQDFTFPISTKTEQEILIELWNARPSAPKDELLGEARIGLRSLFVTSADGGEKWLTLKKRPVGGSDGGTPGGQFLFNFKLNAPKLTYDVDLAMLFPGFQCSVININDYISDEALEKMGSDKRKRQKVLFEIINTEKSYVRDLYMLNQLFVVKLREKEILTREEISSIFANIPTLQDMHLELFKTLESLLEKDRSKTEEEIIERGVMNDGLGDIFLSRANLFKHYAAFCSNHINIGVKIKALQNQKPAFADFLEECFKLPESRGLPIDSFLITPLQRMVKYPLLLDTLIKATSDEHHDYATIKQALLEIKSVVDQVNKRTRQEARVKRMLDLQNQILHGETFNFLDRNRHVVKEGMAKVAGKESYLILFNDVLAFTRKKKEKYDVKAVIQLKGKKWAFLTVVPSFKSSGSTIRKKDMNDPVLVMIPEEDFVDSPAGAAGGFPTITVSGSIEAIPSPGSSGDLTQYLPPPSSPRGSFTPSPASHSPTPSPPSTAAAATPSPTSSASSSSSASTTNPSPPSFTKAASSGSLPMASSSSTAASPPLTPHASGALSAALPAVSSSSSSSSAPSMKNLPETNSNSNQFAEGGIYKFFFKTVEERNEWMTKFRKVAGMTALASPVMPSATTTLSPSAAGDPSPKKSLTEMVKQKDSRRSRIRSVSATVTLPPVAASTTSPSSTSPPPSTAGSPAGSPSPLARNGSESARASATSPRGETAATPSPSSGERASKIAAAAAAAAAAEREAALQQALNERNAEIAEIKKRLEHEEALRKEVQLTCQTLQKKIVDTEKDKAEKIKAEKESSEFLRAEVVKRLHDIEKELSEEREERKRERESRHKLEDKLDKMWDSLLMAIKKNGGGVAAKHQLSWDGVDGGENGGDEKSENVGKNENVGKSESGSKSDSERDESALLSPRSRRRKEEKKKEKLQKKESDSPSGSGRKNAAADTESEGSDMSGSGSDVATRKSGTPTSARSRASTSSTSDKKAQWRKSLWWGNKTASPPASPVGAKGRAAANASLESMPRRDSEADSEGSERDDSRDIKRKQMEKTSSWRSKKNTASLPRTLSHGSMDKHEVRKQDMTKKEAKAKDKEEKKQLKEKEKELKKSNASADKKKASAGKQHANGNGNDEQPRMQRANSLPESEAAAAAAVADADPLALDDEHDEQEEWEIDSTSAKPKKQKKTKANEKKSQKTHKKGGGSDSSSSDEEGDEDAEDIGDDLLVGSPRSKGKGGNTKMKKASSSRSLSRSAGAVATKKVSKQV